MANVKQFWFWTSNSKICPKIVKFQTKKQNRQNVAGQKLLAVAGGVLRDT